MNTSRQLLTRCTAALLASLLASTAALAQTGSQPLNLKLQPGSVPAASTSAADAPAAASTTPIMTGSVPALPAPGADATASHAAATQPAPGVYYGDTSGRMGNTEVAEAPACDDSTYNNAQVHGSVGMGVMAGSHMSGNYQTGSVNVSKRLGSCDDPKGGVSMSISVGTGQFNGRGGRGYWRGY